MWKHIRISINKEIGTNFKIPVVLYSQLMAVAFGMDTRKELHSITT